MKSAQDHQADFGTAPLPEAAAENSVQREWQDFPLVIATMPATDQQRTVAIGVVIVLATAAAVIAPFASIQVGRVDAFIPVLQTVVGVVDLVTATLLFAQFSIQPQRALLALASGYIFSGSFAFLQTLAFPGGYAPAGLIGDRLNTPAWMYVLWHTTFPAAILVYALSKDTTEAARPAGQTGNDRHCNHCCLRPCGDSWTDLDRDGENGISPGPLHYRRQVSARGFPIRSTLRFGYGVLPRWRCYYFADAQSSIYG